MQAEPTPRGRRPRRPTPSSRRRLRPRQRSRPPRQRLMSACSAPQHRRPRLARGTRATWWLPRLPLRSPKQPQKGIGGLHRQGLLLGPSPLLFSR